MWSPSMAHRTHQGRSGPLDAAPSADVPAPEHRRQADRRGRAALRYRCGRALSTFGRIVRVVRDAEIDVASHICERRAISAQSSVHRPNVCDKTLPTSGATSACIATAPPHSLSGMSGRRVGWWARLRHTPHSAPSMGAERHVARHQVAPATRAAVAARSRAPARAPRAEEGTAARRCLPERDVACLRLSRAGRGAPAGALRLRGALRRVRAAGASSLRRRRLGALRVCSPRALRSSARSARARMAPSAHCVVFRCGGVLRVCASPASAFPRRPGAVRRRARVSARAGVRRVSRLASSRSPQDGSEWAHGRAGFARVGGARLVLQALLIHGAQSRRPGPDFDLLRQSSAGDTLKLWMIAHSISSVEARAISSAGSSRLHRGQRRSR